ncbi:MAG: hypothetical protein IT208_15060 [Chthonomonadales bacterium]|nr:hypothetical protein [Chthonomonadales bacterium]
MRRSLRGVMTVALAVPLTCAALASNAAPAERELLGVRIWRDWRTVLSKHGQPTRIEVGSPSVQMAPGMSGAGAFGGMRGPGPMGMGTGLMGSSGMMRPGLTTAPGIGRGGMARREGGLPGMPGMGLAGPGAVGAIGLAGPGAGPGMMTGGMAGSLRPGPMGGGSSLYGPTTGSGPMMPPMPGMMGGGSVGILGKAQGDDDRPSGMMALGMPGFGTPTLLGSSGAGPGMMPGYGGSNTQVQASEGEVTWVYEKGSSTYQFLFNKDGRVIQIQSFGYSDGGKTSRGISLGDTPARVYRTYGWPDSISKMGDTLTLDYSQKSHVAFQLVDRHNGKGMRVVGITVAQTERGAGE